MALLDTTALRKPHVKPDLLVIGLLPLLSLLPSCTADKHVNPSFPLSVSQARHDLIQMQDKPVALRRPVVVLGGWGDVLGLPPAKLAKLLQKATGDDRIIAIGFGMCNNFDACRQRVIERVDEAFPSDDPDRTTEVDVIGFSMGGLVARYSEADLNHVDIPSKRLNVANLYTISTPHRGALLAKVVAPGALARDMKPGSAFMQALDDHFNKADYPVIPYVRLNDLTVSEHFAAPQGQTPYWLPTIPFTGAHNDAYKDPRIVADIARRLRGETPYTTEPPTPLPE